MYESNEIELNVPLVHSEEKMGDEQDKQDNVYILRPNSRARRSLSNSSHPTTSEIFRPRSFFEHDIFSERRILLSSPIDVIDSLGVEVDSATLRKFITNIHEDNENYISRNEVLNSMREDVYSSNATYVLQEEFRIRDLLESNFKKILCCESGVTTLKESSFWGGESNLSPRSVIN